MSGEGVCPRCKQTVPLIWDGTVRPHGDPSNLLLDCVGSMHVPADPDHCLTCGTPVDPMNGDAVTRFSLTGTEFTWCGHECAERWAKPAPLPAPAEKEKQA